MPPSIAPHSQRISNVAHVNPIESTSLIGLAAIYLLYLLIFTVVRSYFRAAIGRQRWKPLHYLTYVVAALGVIHGAVTDQHLNDSPIDLLDAEKVGIIACGVAIAIAAGMRFRWTRLHPKYRPPPRLQRALRGTNRAVQSSSRVR